MVAGDVAAAEAVVDTVLHLEVIHEDGNVMLIICFYRVNKGGWELLQFSHPASIRDDPGPIRDDRRPARHLPWFKIKIRTIVSTWRRMMVLVCWRCSIVKWFLTVAWFQALSSCVHVVNLRKVI